MIAQVAGELVVAASAEGILGYQPREFSQQARSHTWSSTRHLGVNPLFGGVYLDAAISRGGIHARHLFPRNFVTLPYVVQHVTSRTCLDVTLSRGDSCLPLIPPDFAFSSAEAQHVTPRTCLSVAISREGIRACHLIPSGPSSWHTRCPARDISDLPCCHG